MKKILIVEDSMVFGSLLKDRIQSEIDMKVVWTKSYEETVLEIDNESEEFFAAVLDLRLFSSEDMEIIDYVISKSIPVIVCSSEFSDDAQDKMWSKKIVDYILKAGKSSLNLILDSLRRLDENSKIKVLLVDDSSVVRESVGELLKNQNFITFEAEDGVEALQIIEENPDIKLTLTDYYMPNMDGYELTKAIRQKYKKDTHAIIGLSGMGSSRLSVKFLKYGANDFISKPFVVEEFYCRINQNIDMIKTLDAVRHAAMFDYLTSIYNRRYLFQAGTSLLHNAKRNGMSLTVAVFDIDDFKKVNDTYGHETGDIVIKTISNILKSRFRDSDIVARLGGEEFCVMAVNMQIGYIDKIFDDLRMLISKTLIKSDEFEISVTVSVGICSEVQDTLEEMINLADIKLYDAKNGGKDMVCSYVSESVNVS